MRVLYRFDGRLYVSSFDEVVYDDFLHTLSFLTDISPYICFRVPHASAIIALTKLLADGYVDLQSFDCELID